MQSNRKQHVILFFDLNGSMILADPISGKDIFTAINALLAEKYFCTWGVASQQISYREYIENYVCQGDKENLEIKKARNNFYKNFIGYLEESKHSLLKDVQCEYNTFVKMYSEGIIIPAFISLINYLENEKISYSIMLRTFGNDLQNVVKELESKTTLRFSDNISIDANGHMQVNNTILKTPEQMLDMIIPGKHFACQDNYNRWKNLNFCHAGGKPFPLCADKLTIFLDDHSIDKQILNVMSVDKLALKNVTQEKLQKQLIKLGRIVPVNSYEASLNLNYFIEKILFAYQTPLQLSP